MQCFSLWIRNQILDPNPGRQTLPTKKIRIWIQWIRISDSVADFALVV
jgi:hypothetical protein